MGLLDSSLIKNLPAVKGWSNGTSPTFTSAQNITFTNPGGFRTLLVKLSLTGGSWGDTYLTNYSTNPGLVLTSTGAILNRIEKDYGILVVDARFDDVILRAVSTDNIPGKTISYDYIWSAEDFRSFDIRPVQLVTASNIILATGTTSYTFKMLGSANHIDVTPYKYFFISLMSKSGGSLQRLTYTIKKSLAYRDFLGDGNTTRTINIEMLSVANDYLAHSEWIPVESPLLGMQLSIEAGNVVNDAVVSILLYGVR